MPSNDAVFARPSYRESHKVKGADYHRRFERHSYRGVLWTLEREVLDAVAPASDAVHLDYLDFACGTGRVLAYLEPRVKTAAGVDVSASMLTEARRRVQRAVLYQRDLTREACWPPSSFDLITAFRFFANAEPELRVEALRALRALLRPNGRLVFNNHEHLGSVGKRIKRLLGSGGRIGLSHQDVERLVADGGLEVERVYAIGLWPLKERVPRRFVSLLTRLERTAARHLNLASIGNDLIYICRGV